MPPGRPAPKIVIEVMEDVEAPANVDGNPVKRLSELGKYEGGRAGPKREPEVDVHPPRTRVAQERPIRRPEAEGVPDVHFRHKRVPPQPAHNVHGRIHGGIPNRKLLAGNARIKRGSARRGQIQKQVHGAVGLHCGAEGGAMKEPEGRADEGAHSMAPGDLQGHGGGDG